MEWTGGCLCGAVRYRAGADPLRVVSCHCESCRRATGAPMASYAGFAAERFAYTAGAPVRLVARRHPQLLRPLRHAPGL